MKQFVSLTISIFLALFIAFVLREDSLENAERTAHLQQLIVEAKPYADRIEQINDDLRSKEYEIYVQDERTEFVLGFVPTAVEDMAVIEELFSEADYRPVILLDCSQEYETLLALLEEAEQGRYELALAGMVLDREVLQTADKLRREIAERGLADSVPFLLRNSCDTSEGRKELLEHQFDHFMFYSDTYDESGLLQGKYPYMPYIMIQNKLSPAEYISVVAPGPKKLMITYRFQDLYDGVISVDTISLTLEIMEAYREKGSICYSSMQDAFDSICYSALSIADKEKAFLPYKEAQEEQIRIIEENIRGIYSRCNEYQRSEFMLGLEYYCGDIMRAMRNWHETYVAPLFIREEDWEEEEYVDPYETVGETTGDGVYDY